MATVCLVNDDTGEVLEIPPDESTIGRGQLLKVDTSTYSTVNHIVKNLVNLTPGGRGIYLSFAV